MVTGGDRFLRNIFTFDRLVFLVRKSKILHFNLQGLHATHVVGNSGDCGVRLFACLLGEDEITREQAHLLVFAIGVVRLITLAVLLLSDCLKEVDLFLNFLVLFGLARVIGPVTGVGFFGKARHLSGW